MARKSSVSPEAISNKPNPPARSAEELESQLISLATALAEKQLREGTASSQVITHYLKLGSSREKLEQQNKELENELLIAKTDQIKAAKRIDELYADAIAAMKSYAGDV